MFIKKARIRNYRSFQDSGELSFCRGINLIVGANNVGKSSLLHCLPARFAGEPHKSIETLPEPDDTLNPQSRVDFVVVASGEELRKAALRAGSARRLLPWPRDVNFSHSNAESVAHAVLSADQIEFYATATANRDQASPSWSSPTYPVTRLYDALIQPNGELAMLRLAVNVNDKSVRGEHAVVQPREKSDEFGLMLISMLMSSVYRFDAERMSLGHCSVGPSKELSSNAQNLAEVLNILQANPGRFREYNELVREIFPLLKTVSVRPLPNAQNQVEVIVWQVDPDRQREDLAIPLNKCGTGVGQVLAILYVVKTSDSPRTIIIDEPGSFLHPGASRALIGILRRFTNHQYIISTHSPEIISELSDRPVTIVKWSETKSSVEQAPQTTSAQATAALLEVGARLSDVFGYDEVVWVEGQSDAASLKFLLEVAGKSRKRTAFLPVRDTGSFRRRTIAEVLDVYRKLSTGEALLPPAILFLFDREGRDEKEIAEAIKASSGTVRFLVRRMFENYLLDPQALAGAYNEFGRQYSLSTSPQAVKQWIELNAHRFLPAGFSAERHSIEWYANVDGAHLIDELFGDLSQQKLIYRKAIHMPRITEIQYSMDPAKFAELFLELEDVFA